MHKNGGATCLSAWREKKERERKSDKWRKLRKRER
jgi:hypothetical protein